MPDQYLQEVIKQKNEHIAELLQHRPWLRLQEYCVVFLVAVVGTIVALNLIFFPLISVIEEARPVRILTVTAYSPREQETDSTPFINAMGTQVAEGQIAVSDDLFLAGWVFGRRVWIQGQGIYRISDRMNGRLRNTVDIFFFDTKDAYKWGSQKLVVALLGR